MMGGLLRRRAVATLGSAIAMLALAACGGNTPDAQAPNETAPAAITELRIGVTAVEGDPGRLASLDRYETYLETKIGLPVRIYNASDYAGVAQAMEADQIELAFVGPSNYAGMHLRLGDKVRPILAPQDGAYYSIMYVRADGPYRTLEDLRGKTLAFADVNSASGYLIPNHLLRKEGKDPASFFGRTIFGGGHEQAIIAVLKGQADAGVTWSSLQGSHASGYTFGAPRLMVNSGLLDMNDLRIVWRGGPLPPGPVVANVERLPPALLQTIIDAHLALAAEAPEAYRLLAGGESTGYAPTSHEAYADIVDLRRQEEAARRAR